MHYLLKSSNALCFTDMWAWKLSVMHMCCLWPWMCEWSRNRKKSLLLENTIGNERHGFWLYLRELFQISFRLLLHTFFNVNIERRVEVVTLIWSFVLTTDGCKHYLEPYEELVLCKFLRTHQFINTLCKLNQSWDLIRGTW